MIASCVSGRWAALSVGTSLSREGLCSPFSAEEELNRRQRRKRWLGLFGSPAAFCANFASGAGLPDSLPPAWPPLHTNRSPSRNTPACLPMQDSSAGAHSNPSVGASDIPRIYHSDFGRTTLPRRSARTPCADASSVVADATPCDHSGGKTPP